MNIESFIYEGEVNLDFKPTLAFLFFEGDNTALLLELYQKLKHINPDIEVELIFDDKELDLSTRQADIGIWMRRPKQLNYIQKN